MLTSRRDYILRIIDEVGLLVSRVLLQRKALRHTEALSSMVQACERLFQMEAAQLFQFTPDQHFLMLVKGELPELAQQKILLYAALTAEAGRCYQARGNAPLARQSFLTALRLSLKARQAYPAENEPAYAPNPAELLVALGGAALDADMQALVAAAGLLPE